MKTISLFLRLGLLLSIYVLAAATADAAAASADNVAWQFNGRRSQIETGII